MIVETKDYSYAVKLALREETDSKEFIEDTFKDHVYKLWDVFEGKKRVGVVISMKFSWVYTLDGYSETKNFMTAVKAGKLACEEIFKVTDKVLTMHLETKQRVTLLAKRIGFKEYKRDDGYVFLKKEKVWA